MATMKTQVTWKTIVLPLIGIAAFIAYLQIFQVSIPEIIATIQQADPLLYSLAALLVFVDVFFHSLAWHQLINFLSVKLSVLKSCLYVWYGIYVDIIIPAESLSGEISRIYLVTRMHSNDVAGKVAASLVAQRLIGMGIGTATLLIGMWMLMTEVQVNSVIFNLTLFLVFATLFFAFLLLFLCIKKSWTLKIIDWVISFIEHISRGKWKLAKIKEEAVKLADIFHVSIRAFGHTPKVVIVSIILTALSWMAYLGISYLCFLALNFKVSWSIIIMTQAVVSAVKSIPLGVPFEVGLPEITMTTFYGLLGVPLGISATATILNRVLTLWLRFFVGFIAQQWIEIGIARASSNSVTLKG